MNGQWLGSRSIRTNWATRKPPASKGKEIMTVTRPGPGFRPCVRLQSGQRARWYSSLSSLLPVDASSLLQEIMAMNAKGGSSSLTRVKGQAAGGNRLPPAAAIYKRVAANFLPDYVFLIFSPHTFPFAAVSHTHTMKNRTRLISVMGRTKFGLNFFN